MDQNVGLLQRFILGRWNRRNTNASMDERENLMDKIQNKDITKRFYES